MGSLRRRTPVAWKTAFATAALVPTLPNSPMPLTRTGPRQALDGRDLAPVGHRREHHAGEDAPSVEVHGARTALPVTRAFLGTGEPGLVTDRIEQRRARVEPERMLLPVDAQSD